MTEIWKDIKGYEGKYQVSNLGRIKSLQMINNKFGIVVHRERILKPTLRTNYLGITLSKDNTHKNFIVHRLVAEAFIPNPKGLPCVNHKDENKLNNNAENLEWCTSKYNSNYGHSKEKMIKSLINNTRTSKPVRCIETGIIYPSAAEAERQTGVKACNISLARNGKYNTAGGYHWKYIDEEV